MNRSMASLAVCLTLIANSTMAHGAIMTMTTAAHPVPNSLAVDAYIGDFPPVGILAYSSPVLGATGFAVVDVNLDATNSGTIEVLDSELLLDSVPTTTVPLLTLGTVDVTITSWRVRFVTGQVPVSNGQFTVTTSTPGYIQIFDGELKLENPTGAMATILPGGLNYDFGISPETLAFRLLLNDLPGTADIDGSHYSPYPELNIGNPTFVANSTLLLPVYLTLTFGIHAAVIPEAASSLLVGVAALAMAGGALVRRRFRRARA